MLKKWIGLFVVISFLLSTPFTTEAKEPHDIYPEPITVKLVPSVNFTVVPTGDYELINRDNGQRVSFRDEIQFRYGKNRVDIRRANGDIISSKKGYILREKRRSDNHYVTITSVNRGGSGFTPTEYRGSLIIAPGESGSDRLTLYNVLDIEDYLKGVVPREMSPSWPKEALKAQAVAARNYAKLNMQTNKFLYDTVQHQVYHGKSVESPNSNRAVEETKGLYATYNGSLIYAYYHSSSGGHTENSENVWSSALPYIRAVEDPYDLHSVNPNTSWTETVSKNKVSEAIFPEKDWELIHLRITERSATGRVQKMEAVGVNTKTGEQRTKQLPEGSPDSLRWALGTTLKSTLFDMKEKSSSVKVKMADGQARDFPETTGMKIRHADGTDTVIAYDIIAVRTLSGVEYARTGASEYVFTGRGWGHGLGMSQWGAYKMANDGKTFREILKHYYTGIEIERR